jgi:hypothetical protein
VLFGRVTSVPLMLYESIRDIYLSVTTLEVATEQIDSFSDQNDHIWRFEYLCQDHSIGVAV